MKLALMQPYIFPYIGYFQLIHSVDTFVVYDDVNFVKQGWINRNRILVNGKDLLFSVPIKNISSFVPINRTEVDAGRYGQWAEKFLRSLEISYRKAPLFREGYELVSGIVSTEPTSISALAAASLMHVASYLGIAAKTIPSSAVYANTDLSGVERVLDICKKEKASEYVNVASGQHLYSRERFEGEGVRLHFLKSRPIAYKQFSGAFVAGLSIIDVIMFNPVEVIRAFLDEYDLV